MREISTAKATSSAFKLNKVQKFGKLHPGDFVSALESEK